jgi:hypothetical protein
MASGRVLPERRRIAPARESRRGRLHGGVDVGCVAERHAAHDGSERRIGHLAVALARGRLALAADPEVHARDSAGVFRFVHCMLLKKQIYRQDAEDAKKFKNNNI